MRRCAGSRANTNVGIVYQIHRRYYGSQGDPLIVIAQADSWMLNPRPDRKRIECEFEVDPEAAQSEGSGQFRAPTSVYLPRAVISALGRDRRRFQYFAGSTPHRAMAGTASRCASVTTIIMVASAPSHRLSGGQKPRVDAI